MLLPRREDHPRLRGEHNTNLLHLRYLPGSPPLTRGTLSQSSVVAEAGGITPAYAGNTVCSLCGSGFRRDHPRLRGEHWFTTSGTL